MPARTLNLILGLWLFASAFIWRRPPASFTNAWVVGLLVAVVAVVAMRAERARFVNTALSAWLFASAFLLPAAHAVARWNDLAVSAAVLLLSLVPGSMYSAAHARRRAAGPA